MGTGDGGGAHFISIAPVTSVRISTLGALHAALGAEGAAGGTGIFAGPPVIGAGAGAAGGAGIREGPPVTGAGGVGGFGITICGMAPGAGCPLGSDMGLGGMGFCGIAACAAAMFGSSGMSP